MYKCKYFKIYELVPESLYKAYGEWCWNLLDERALITLDALRERFGSLTVNNYKWNGIRSDSGFRDASFYKSIEEYSKSRSQHKYGRAFDFISNTHKAADIRKYIIENPTEFPYITFLEVGPIKRGKAMSWVHFDTRNCDFTCWSPVNGVVSPSKVIKEGW